jgi:hypothetical protein
LNLSVFSLIKDIDSTKKSDLSVVNETIEPTGYFIEQTSSPFSSNPQYSPIILITSFIICIKSTVANAGDLLKS